MVRGSSVYSLSPLRHNAITIYRATPLKLYESLHTGHLRGHIRNTPDWVRRSIRLSLSLVIFGLLGHSIHYPGQWSSEVSKSFNWAAITCVVVTAPLIGKASETANYRVVGTISGGLWGFFMWWLGAALFGTHGSGTFVALVSPVLVVATTYLAYKRGMDQLAKYMQITYIVCGYGTFLSSQDAITLTMIRISGIISGAVVSLLLGCIILPRSASVETCREIKKALKLIVDLNHEIWKNSSSPVPKVFKDRRGHHHESTLKMVRGFSSTGQMNRMQGDQADQAGGSDSNSNQNEVVAEKIFIKSALTMSKIDEMIESTKAEIYIHHLWGSYFFLPGLLAFPLGSWHLPEEDVTQLVCSIRRIFRLQWSLLLNMQDGMDSNLQALLQSNYPKGIMTELADAMQRTLLDLHSAFPDGDGSLAVDNLLNLGSVIDALIDISDAKHREAVNVKRVMREKTYEERANRKENQAAGGRSSMDQSKRGYEANKGSGDVVLDMISTEEEEKTKLIASSRGLSDSAPQEEVIRSPSLIHHQPLVDHQPLKPSLVDHQPLKLETVLSGQVEELKSGQISLDLTVQFPDTSEGFASMVQWHSFQFLLDELVEELEEAFVACSQVIDSLPHPIK